MGVLYLCGYSRDEKGKGVLVAGELGFFEVRVADGERGRAFWGGLFGWRFEEGNFRDYYMIPSPSRPGA